MGPFALLAFGLGLVLFFALLRWGWPRGPNPFAADARRPPAPLVTDKAARRAVLKAVFSADKVPAGLDAIVIGSGIGGLAAAVLLAKAGRRVLVLEQHGKLGGCCHTFSEKGFEFDTGIHYVGEMHERCMMRFIVDQLTEGQLEWVPMPAAYDAVVLGEPKRSRAHHVLTGRKEYFDGLRERFPRETAAIDEFEQLTQSISGGMKAVGMLKLLPLPLARLLCHSGLLPWLSPFCRMASRSLKDVVDSLTANAELRAIFSYIFPTYGVPPSKASFSMHSILVNHYLYGAWYPKGGSGEIAFHTIPIIQRAGGNVLGRAPVQSILLDSQGRACGVSVKKGQDLVNIFAPTIISDAGLFNTYERLLPAEARALPEIQSQLGMVKHGEASFSVFVGLTGSSQELGLEATNYFVYPGNNLDEIMKRYLTSSRDEAAKSIPFLFVTCPSAKDPTWETRHPGKSTLAIVTFAKYEWFEEWKDEQVNKRGDAYEDLKKTFVDAVMEVVFKLYPNIEDKIEYISGGSPLTNQHYIASPQGEIYGIDHDIARTQAEAIATMRPQTAVPNLYLTGQDVFMCGFMGALHGALFCASAVLNRNVHLDALRLRKRTRATTNDYKKRD
ncbi:all-trans-retinol 13,14-reductase isoform X2 [Cygnus olor]|uniref:all-trans-retinol 13,14-reductase isoform X2 n=1 Tax=Cygnus olor TaxID=8869 RepID=UPI001ADE0E61|nr:all-trans-retinol 13,14-reductase isoform X2 [Cygnus olor]